MLLLKTGNENISLLQVGKKPTTVVTVLTVRCCDTTDYTTMTYTLNSLMYFNKLCSLIIAYKDSMEITTL